MLHEITKGDELGQGSYGVVYSVDYIGDKYALKRNLADTESTFIGAIRELDILHTLRDHPNVITLNMVIFGDVFEKKFEPLSGEDREAQRDDEVHFIFPKAEQDLYDFINEEEESFKYVKRYMVDILMGVEYMHNHHIIHRDLKPGNILIFKDHVVKICDFGFSKPYTTQGDQTPGIVTVSYRAPEVLLSDPNYDYKIDVWSIGCVFFEMISKRTLITEIEEDDAKLLKNVLEILPTPLNAVQFKQWITNCKSKQFNIRNLSGKKLHLSFYEQLDLSRKGIKDFTFHCGDLKLFCDLLDHMISFHPSNRYNIHQCLDHSFFDSDREHINQMRNRYQSKIYKESPIVYHLCQEREWMAQTAICLFKSRQDLEWYNHRCLFQAIDMFHRYLHAIDDVKHDEFHTNLLFMTCIYISIKYFSSIHVPLPFSAIVQEEFLTPECNLIVSEFEGGLIKNCFKYDIYNPTIYEAADVLNDHLGDDDVYNLLMIFSQNCHLEGKLPSDVYKYYKLIKNKPDQLLKAF